MPKRYNCPDCGSYDIEPVVNMAGEETEKLRCLNCGLVSEDCSGNIVDGYIIYTYMVGTVEVTWESEE